MKPNLSIVRPEIALFNSRELEAKAWVQQQVRFTKDRVAAGKLERTSNLTTAPKWRRCLCGKCGVVVMSAHRTTAHIPPAELIADWQTDKRDERLEDLDMDVIDQAPVEKPLKPAVSQAQVRWARDMIAQYPKKSREQISLENSGISWAQLEHYARSSTEGLPERRGQKPAARPAQQAGAPAKSAGKAKATKNVKGA
jgi:hypothetical protein